VDARVYIEHTDAYGVVFYANYFAFASHAAEELGIVSTRDDGGGGGGGGDGDGDFDFGRAFRCVRIENCKYARAATLGDALVVRSEVVRADERSATLRQEIVSANDDARAFLSAEITYARVVDIDGVVDAKPLKSDGGESGTIAAPWAMNDGACTTTAVRMYRGERSLGAAGCSHVDVLRFFERGRTDAIGGSNALSALQDAGVVVVVSRLEAYFPPCDVSLSKSSSSGIPVYDVKSTVELKRRGIQVVFHQAIFDDDGTCVGYGDITCTCLDANTMRPMPCPPTLVDTFAPFTV
jgi:acyl-CoA thioesterase FadM